MPEMILECEQCGEQQTSNGVKVVCSNCGLSGVDNFTLRGYPQPETGGTA